MENSITPLEFKEQMLKLQNENPWDKEMFHAKADVLLCKTLRQLGFEEGVKVFEDTDKWYA